MPTIIAIVIALIAVAVAVAAWFRPAPKAETSSPKTYSEQETADAKKAVCGAYETVHYAVGVNTGRNGGTDPTAILAVAANARLSLYGGGGYLVDTLQANPATPADLAEPVRKLSSSYREIAIGYLADKNNTDLQAALGAADQATVSIQDACR